MKENWVKVKGYEDLYLVSDLGNVKSLDRISTYKYKGNNNDIRSRKWNGHDIKQTMSSTQKYFMVCLIKNGNRKLVCVHKLVAIAFLNHKTKGYDGLIIDHINNNKEDNRALNLQEVTARYNVSKDRLLKIKTSKYTGVYYKKKNKKWCASIYLNGVKKHLGLFNCEYDAHLSYKEEVDKLFDQDKDNRQICVNVKKGLENKCTLYLTKLK